MAKRLEAARVAIEPQIGASTYSVTSQAIETQPGGANNTLNQSATRCSRSSSGSTGSLCRSD